MKILVEDIAPPSGNGAIRGIDLFEVEVQTFLQKCVGLHGFYDPGDLELSAVDGLARAVGVWLLARDLVPEVVPVRAIV